MSRISEMLKGAKTSRNRFMKFWTEMKKYDIEQLRKFTGYKEELQIGIMIEWLGMENIGIVGYNSNYDLFIINPNVLPVKDKLLNETKSHFIYEYRDGFVFINDSRKHKQMNINTVLDGYVIAICTAINWLNYDDIKI